MKVKYPVHLKLALFVVLIAMLLSACSSGPSTPPAANQPGASKTAEPLKIGVVLPLTGGFAFAGKSLKEAFDLKLEEVNSKGGINGRKIEPIILDEEDKPDVSVRHFNKLIRDDKVKIILGPTTTANAKAVEAIAEREGVLFYSWSGAYVPPPKSFAFASTYSQTSMHQLIHTWMKSKGWKKMAMLAANDASGDLSVKIVNETAAKDGIETKIERFGVDAVDVTPILAKVKAWGPEAIVVVGPGRPAAVAIQNAAQMGLEMPIVATHSQVSSAFAQSIKGYVPKQMYFTGPPIMAWRDLSDKNPLKPGLKAFAESFAKRYSKDPDYYNTFGYDTMGLLFDTIAKAGDDPVKLRDALQTTKSYTGVHAVFNLTPEDHRGTSIEGPVMLTLDSNLKWGIGWDPLAK